MNPSIVLHNAYEILATSLLVFLLAWLSKYISHLRDEDRARAHFDCFRIGNDLALVGLVLLGTIVVAALDNPSTSISKTVLQSAVVIALLQFFLILASTALMATYPDNSTRFSTIMGAVVPFALGFFSVAMSILLFHQVYLTHP